MHIQMNSYHNKEKLILSNVSKSYNNTLVLEDINIKVINGSAFRSLTISEIYLPNTIETLGTRVFDSSDLERITTSPYEINNELPNSLTSLGTYVFTNSKIREVVFTSGVAIDSNVFDNANLLETLIFHNDVMFPSSNSNYILRNTA